MLLLQQGKSKKWPPTKHLMKTKITFCGQNVTLLITLSAYAEAVSPQATQLGVIAFHITTRNGPA